MPFTPTHVAAAIPIAWLSRGRLPFSAIAIGTMVSDLPVFYPALMDYATTHSWLGILTHCLPIGMVGYYLFHTLMKEPLADLLPDAVTNKLRSRIDQPVDFSPSSMLAVAACVTLGAASHIFWDSFTHHSRWGVQVFPALREVAYELAGYQLRWFAVLQHGSSLLFLPLMAAIFWRWVQKLPEAAEPSDRARFPRGLAWGAVSLMLIAAPIHFVSMRQHHPDWLWITALHRCVRDSGAVFLAVTLAYCCGMRAIWWRDRRDALKTKHLLSR